MPFKAGAMAGRGAWIVRALLAAGFVLLLGVMFGVWQAARGTELAEARLAHTLNVRHHIERLRNNIVDMETGQRGYLLTGRDTYLDPYRAGRADLPVARRELGALVADNPGQAARLADIDALLTQRIELLERVLAEGAEGRRPLAQQMMRDGPGKILMDAIRDELDAMDRAELALFDQRLAHSRRERNLFLASIIVMILTTLALAAAVFVATGRYVRSLEEGNAALKREMTARESAQGQLRQAQKMDALGRLTGGVAHDFNNMLAIIVGSLDLLLRRMGDGADAKLRDLATNALDGAKRAASLTQRLLAFSRQQALEPKVIDPNKIAADMSVVLQRTLGATVEVETVLAGGLWRAFIDQPQLESAILNLAVNARDAMGGAGKITIETANTYLDQAYAATHEEVEPGQYVMVAVTDTGSGMSAEVMARAFDPFFTTKGGGEGTGLGLSQVHGFIKQSGGHVKIYSEPGVGTTVKLYMPRHTGPLDAETPAPAAPQGPILCTVLVAEDEAGVRAFTAEALRELGCNVVEAENAAEALVKLGANPEIAVLLTDVVMPGDNGRKLADEAVRRRPDLKVIYMTGYTRNAIVHNGMLDPGTNLLSKPFTVAQLELELKSVLGG